MLAAKASILSYAALIAAMSAAVAFALYVAAYRANCLSVKPSVSA